MRYKNTDRILCEILAQRGLPVDVILEIARLVNKNRRFPRLGPFRKRSTSQVLWRAASDSRRDGVERWVAFKALLKVESDDRAALGKAAVSDPQQSESENVPTVK